MVVYNKEDNPMKLVLIDSVYPTKEGNTYLLNIVVEAKQFLVINIPAMEVKRRKEERRRQKDQLKEMPSYELEGLFNKMDVYHFRKTSQVVLHVTDATDKLVAKIGGTLLIDGKNVLQSSKKQLFSRIVRGPGQRAEEGVMFSELEVTPSDIGLEK
ncbi:hypothetical protein KY290_027422 [Solanum tuberosum]|uniref:Uncharacterized protein n=1 Tax=Solanum tuberosum TaxID=4113 RepID=A0ABQ7UF04_SOLTU|nr:hypothetical protein KY290_027422 [Solanum tuberosum]